MHVRPDSRVIGFLVFGISILPRANEMVTVLLAYVM